MTTTITVEAHCAAEKEVLVKIETEQLSETIRVQNGDTWSGVVYDDKTVTVCEALKE